MSAATRSPRKVIISVKSLAIPVAGLSDRLDKCPRALLRVERRLGQLLPVDQTHDPLDSPEEHGHR